MNQTLEIDGRTFEGHAIATPKGTLLFILGTRGFLGCGYFDYATADKIGDALAIVRGVKSFDDMLAASVVTVSRAAAEAGVQVGRSGREALALLA